MEKISIVVPHRSEHGIERCLSSIRDQTYPDKELVVVEDPEGKGPWWARNQGLKSVTGKYVTFCDSDDYLEDGALQKMAYEMEGVDLVVGSFRKFGLFEQTVSYPTTTLDKWQVAMYAMSNLRNPRENQMLSGCWGKLYKRDRLGKFPELMTAEDMAFNFDYLKTCNSVRFISDVVYNNQKREGSLTQTFNPKDKYGLFGFLKGLQYVKCFLSDFYSQKEIDEALDHSKVYHSALYFMRICESQNLPMREAFKKLYG